MLAVSLVDSQKLSALHKLIEASGPFHYYSSCNFLRIK